ncbi:MAG: VanZ family protein [Pirellulales bacterium]|nr:VanZ family protein [Pirellulales bacterium]
MSRTISLIYLAFLTLLLVVRNPLDWFGQQELIVSAFRMLGFIVHFATFVVLAFLMLMARWPLSNATLLGLLAVYAGFTELIQGPIPNRSPEWGDFLQDLGGLAVGTILWFVVSRWWISPRATVAESTLSPATETGIRA